MHAGVQIEHELPERAFQSRQGAPQHDEARAGEFGGRGEIHQPQRLAQLEMLLRREVEVVWRPVLRQHDVGALIGAVRHLEVQDIGQPLQGAADRRVQGGGAGFQPLHLRP